jgi:vacuolar-type H+-ATPase subunit E/Vma4
MIKNIIKNHHKKVQEDLRNWRQASILDEADTQQERIKAASLNILDFLDINLNE